MSYRTGTLVLIVAGAAWFGWWGHRSGAPLMLPWTGAQVQGDSVRADSSAAGTTPVSSADSALVERRERAITPGWALYSNGLLREAVTEFDRVIAADSGNMRAYMVLGTVHRRLEDHDAALAVYLAAMRAVPGDPAPYAAVEAACRRGYADACSALRERR